MLAHLLPVWDWTAAGWAATAAWATFGVAVTAAVFAKHQVDLARETRQEQAQPFVVVDFEPSKPSTIHMDLIIRNVGTTIATDVKAVFDPPIVTTMDEANGEYVLGQSAIITDGIPTLVPGREYRMLFDSMPDRYASDLPRSYDVTVAFRDNWRREYTLRYRLDLDHYFGYTSLSTYGEHDAAKALRDIAKTVDKWSAFGGGLRAWIRDEDAKLERDADRMRERRASLADPEPADGAAPTDPTDTG